MLDGFDCTPLQVERLAEGDYAIRGYVAGRADLKRLDAELGAIAHATIDISSVAAVPRPLCPLLELAGHYSTEPRLSILPNHPDGRYTTGDEFNTTFRHNGHASGRCMLFHSRGLCTTRGLQSALIRRCHGSVERLRSQRTRNRSLVHLN